jgi:hypothetical protein
LKTYLLRTMERLDRGLRAVEAQLTLPIAALLLAVITMSAMYLHLRPSLEPVSHGTYYAELATNPFDPNNPYAYRILTPLIAYLIGLRGHRIIFLNLIMATLLLAAIYYAYRRKGYAPVLCASMVLMMGVTMPTLFTIYFGGYIDSTSYLLVFIGFLLISNPIVFSLTFFLGLLNREAVIFLLPFFAIYHGYTLKLKGTLKGMLPFSAGALISLGVYLVVRKLIESIGVPQFSGSYYLEPLKSDKLYWLRRTIYAYPTAFFSPFKFFWLLPIIAIAVGFRKRNMAMIAIILVLIMSVMAQSVITVDTTRNLTMAFPVLLISATYLREWISEQKLALFLLICAVVNLLTPHYYVSSNLIVRIE